MSTDCYWHKLPSHFMLILNFILIFNLCFASLVQTEVDWLYVYPPGLEKTVTYIKERYNNTPMFITENGQ